MATPFEFDFCPACGEAIDLIGDLYTHNDDVVCSPQCVQTMHFREAANAEGQ